MFSVVTERLFGAKDAAAAAAAAASVAKYYSETSLCASKYLEFRKSRFEFTS